MPLRERILINGKRFLCCLFVAELEIDKNRMGWMKVTTQRDAMLSGK